ncbi:MAG: hypothetical protein V2A61_08095, partial [Calditrichota bacterium]
LLAFVTSHNTLDAPTAKPVRELLAEQADFISAVRLPDNSFGDPKVVTDIVFMRKREPGEPPGDKNWIETTQIELPGGEEGRNRQIEVTKKDAQRNVERDEKGKLVKYGSKKRMRKAILY